MQPKTNSISSLNREISNHLSRFPQTLQVNQLEVLASDPQQLLMGPALHDPPLVEHVDDIRLLDGTQAMSHGDCRSPFCRSVKSRLDDFFGLAIKRGGCFVEKQDFGVA